MCSVLARYAHGMTNPFSRFLAPVTSAVRELLSLDVRKHFTRKEIYIGICPIQVHTPFLHCQSFLLWKFHLNLSLGSELRPDYLAYIKASRLFRVSRLAFKHDGLFLHPQNTLHMPFSILVNRQLEAILSVKIVQALLRLWNYNCETQILRKLCRQRSCRVSRKCSCDLRGEGGG